MSALKKSSAILLALILPASALALRGDAFNDAHAAVIIDKTASEIGASQKDATRELALAPNSASLLGLRAAAYDETNRPELAWPDAENAVAADPKDAFAVLQSGLSGEKLGKPDEQTLADIRRAGELDPSFSHFYAEALARRGLQPEAGSGQKPAADLAPSYPTASRRPAAVAGFCSLLICAGMYFLLGRLWKDDQKA